jgi:adenylylsulfate kinase-like enzyme
MQLTIPDQPLLVIVTGPPGSGKTTLGRRLARDLCLPFLNKDDIKEILFDSLGWIDREWSQKLGRASIEILFHVLENELKARRSLVVETAFIPEYHDPRLLSLEQIYSFFPVQVYLTAQVDILYERFRRRVTSGERHPGHFDQFATYDQFIEIIRLGKYDPLNVGGSFFEVDTGDWEKIDYSGLLSTLKTCLSPVCNPKIA